MHFLVGVGIIAALIGFAFGEIAARMFVGALLAIGAIFVLFIGYVVALDSVRQPLRQFPTVHMEPSK